MLPYFKLAEDNERGEDDYHGAGGPLSVSEGRSRNPLAQAFLDSAAAPGWPRTTTSTARSRTASAGTR